MHRPNKTHTQTHTDQIRLRLIQTKIHFKCFLKHSVRIKTTHNPSKVAAAKKSFLPCVCYRCNLLQWMFFVRCDYLKTLCVKHKFVATLRFFQLSFCCFIWSKCFERSPYFTLSSQCKADSKVSKIKLSYTKFILDTFVANLFYVNVFYSWLFHFSLCKWIFVKNSKPLWKHDFTQ